MEKYGEDPNPKKNVGLIPLYQQKITQSMIPSHMEMSHEYK